MTGHAPRIGDPLPRVEDRPFLDGSALYLDDLYSEDAIPEVAFVRSTIAAGHIMEIDTSGARELPDVFEVYTADALNLPGLVATSRRPEFTPITIPLLATTQVRYVGEPVAAVVARDRASAEAAALAVQVEYAPSHPAIDIDTAIEAGVAINEGTISNVLLETRHWDVDEVSTALVEAPVRIALDTSAARLAAAPLECRGCVAQFDNGTERLIVHASTQVPHLLRAAIAAQLKVTENHVRVLVPEVGGGFGLKCNIGREELVVSWIAWHTKSRVRWAEDRYQNLAFGFHAREQKYSVEAALAEDGRFLAMYADIRSDVGAYSSYPFGYGLEPMQAASDMTGPYKVPLYSARSRAIATNKPPSAPYRGVARPNVTFTLELLMDHAAAVVGIDRLELRKRNLIKDDDFPYRSATGLTYDKGSYLEALERCAELLDYAAWLPIQEKARKEGRYLGLGFSCFTEHAGYGSPVFSKRMMSMTVGGETVRLRMDPTGGIDAMVGTLSHGQGHKTTYAQIIADELRVPLESIRIIQGDTDATPVGWGTFASRSISVAGGALTLATKRLAERLKLIASKVLEIDPADLKFADSHLVAVDEPSTAVALAEVARWIHYQVQDFDDAEDLRLDVEATFDPPGAFANATYGAKVEVDVETGLVDVLDFVAVEDCGQMINPLVVDGQIRGGVVQGIAAALWEEIVYDSEGQPKTVLASDYLTPSAREIPDIRIAHLSTPSDTSMTGAKGMGEGGCIGAPAAVINAINDAIGPIGARVTEIPASPVRIVRAIESARGSMT